MTLLGTCGPRYSCHLERSALGRRCRASNVAACHRPPGILGCTLPLFSFQVQHQVAPGRTHPQGILGSTCLAVHCPCLVTKRSTKLPQGETRRCAWHFRDANDQCSCCQSPALVARNSVNRRERTPATALIVPACLVLVSCTTAHRHTSSHFE